MVVPQKLKIDRRRLERLSPIEREEAEAEIRNLEQAIEQNPLIRYNNPRFGPVHPKQMLFHEMVAMGLPEVAYMGGNQSGKTTSGCVDDIIQCVDEDAVPPHLKRFKKHKPPFRCRIGGQGREELQDFVFEKLKEWVPMSQLVGDSWKKAYDSLNHVLHFKNGSFIQFKTYMQEGNQWGGSTLDRVHLDEEPRAVHLKESRIRVMRRQGQVIFSMTPVEGISHTYETFEKNILAAEDSPTGSSIVDREIELGDDNKVIIQSGFVYSDMDDNPWLTETAKAIALQGLSEEERLARKKGRFVAMSGLVYKRWDEPKHVIPPLERLPDNVNVIVSIDPGWRYATAVGFHYLDTQGNMVMFDELHLKEHKISEVCAAIRLVEAEWNFVPIYYVIDSAAMNHNNQTGRSDQMEYADHGIITILAQKSVKAGINRCREIMDRGQFHVTENCVNFRREIRMYRYKKPPKIKEEDAKDEPVKMNDHQMDQWRYAVMSRAYLPDEVDEENETELERIIRQDIEANTNPPAPVA